MRSMAMTARVCVVGCMQRRTRMWWRLCLSKPHSWALSSRYESVKEYTVQQGLSCNRRAYRENALTIHWLHAIAVARQVCVVVAYGNVMPLTCMHATQDPFPSWPRRGLPLFPGCEKLIRTGNHHRTRAWFSWQPSWSEMQDGAVIIHHRMFTCALSMGNALLLLLSACRCA
jgi:hypothetical protein